MPYLVDVNVIVNALRSDSSFHRPASTWLNAVYSSPESALVLTETLVASVQILSNPRIWQQTPSVYEATQAVDLLVERGYVDVVGSSQHAWVYFASIASELPLQNGDVPDALLAAQARSLSLPLVTFDRGFSKYPDLDAVSPTQLSEQ